MSGSAPHKMPFKKDPTQNVWLKLFGEIVLLRLLVSITILSPKVLEYATVTLCSEPTRSHLILKLIFVQDIEFYINLVNR